MKLTQTHAFHLKYSDFFGERANPTSSTLPPPRHPNQTPSPRLASPLRTHSLFPSSRLQVCSLVKILDLLSRAEASRGGFMAANTGASETDTDSPTSADGDGGPGRRRGLLRHGAPRSAAPGVLPTDGQGARRRGLTSTAAAAAGRRQEELELLRQAVQLEDALGYDEPRALPVPTRLYLAAALLRRDYGDAAGGDEPLSADQGRQGAAMTTAAAGKDEAEEAESVLRELDVQYPNMGRTLLGLWRACSVLGKDDEARGFRERFVASWQYSEVWLADSAHVGGVGAQGQADVGANIDSGGVALSEEDRARVDRGSGRTTNAVVFIAAIAVAALSLGGAGVVAARTNAKARLCSMDSSFSRLQLPWEWNRTGAEAEETTNVAQAQAGPWPDMGSTRNGYQTIGESRDE